MASFTMYLEEVIEMEGESNIGLNEYPIFDESHRPVLNKKIIDHYYNQEIGQENISMFRLAMKRKMNEIMPAFNQQYELSAIKLEALLTASMTTTGTNTGNTAATNTGTTASSNTGTTTSTTEGETTSGSDAKSRAVASNFPQNSLQAGSEYATSAQDNISNSTATGNSNETQSVAQNDSQSVEQNGTQEVEQTGSTTNLTTGYQGHQPELIFAARQTIVNIDLEIINALDTLFMGVWGTSAEYSRVRNHYDYPFGW